MDEQKESRQTKVIAFVGSGGKTTKIHQYARYYRGQGLTVFVTTTTHMGMEEDMLVTDQAEPVIERLRSDGYCMACAPKPREGEELARAKEEGRGERKLVALPADVYEKACAYADIVLVEADGSRQLPMKCPNETEPVIPDNTDEIRIIIGLSALGKVAKDVCHRPERLASYGIDKEVPVTASAIQKVLTEGYVKPLRAAYPNVKVSIEPFRIDDLYDRAVAAFLQDEQDVSVLEEHWFDTQPKLVICGAGHVGAALWQVAHVLGFELTLIDDRPDFLSKEQYPDTTLICCEFSQIEQYLPKEKNTYYVIATHGHKGDLDCAKACLKQDAAYVGMIGSKTKVAFTHERLAEAGFGQELRSQLHAPVGLKIGAKTPAEIAVSIMAEIIQEKNQNGLTSLSVELKETKKEGVLCIITKKTGSSPGNPGCMMLVGPDGCVGTVGGGSLEQHVTQLAPHISSIETRSYDVGSSNKNGLGMVCGGSNEILFIPLEELSE
jgi:xanthine dehydrogenase accessory factor